MRFETLEATLQKKYLINWYYLLQYHTWTMVMFYSVAAQMQH